MEDRLYACTSTKSSYVESRKYYMEFQRLQQKRFCVSLKNDDEEHTSSSESFTVPVQGV